MAQRRLGMAREVLDDLKQPTVHPQNIEQIARTIVKLALEKGFFSVLIPVFRHRPDMLNRFIQAFPGTDAGSFNDEDKTVHRADGQF